MNHAAAAALAACLVACSAPRPIESEPEPPADAIGDGWYSGTSSRAGDLLLPLVVMRHPETRVEVTIIGMVHLADAAFYDAATRECAAADLVLTEGVRGTASLSPFLFVGAYVLALPRRLSWLTGLPLQSEAFGGGQDRERWVNGDVDLDEWSDEMPWYTPLAQAVVGPLLALAVEPACFALWLVDESAAACCSRREAELSARHVIAKVLAEDDYDDDDALLPGVLDWRNERLLARLDEELDARPSVRRVALPWGAAHVAGLKALLEERGFKVVASRWLTGWSVRSARRDEPRPSGFWVPWVVHWRAFRGAGSFSVALDSVLWQRRASGAWKIELLWELLFSLGSDPQDGGVSFRLGPVLFGGPLLFERTAERDGARWRFLVIFEVGG